MRVCFTSDLHGAASLYEQLEELLRAQTPDLLILGGDLFPDGERDDPLGTQVAYVERDFIPRLASWRALAPRLTIACCVGNHEWRCAGDVLGRQHDAGRLVLLDHHRVWMHRGVSFLGYGLTPATPHWVKDFERLDLPIDPVPTFGGVVWDVARKAVRYVVPAAHFIPAGAISTDLNSAVRAAPPWILVAHCPPYETKLDRLPTLPAPVGSRAVRQFIEVRQPLVSLHGHIHESPEVTGRYRDNIGQTLCINPGQGPDRLHAVLFDSDNPVGTMRHTLYG
jgi:Icc-related predicted phosphoesterase